MIFRNRLSPRLRRDGVALVILLALIVLLTGLVIAFFSRALSGQQIATTSTGNLRAELLAQSASDLVISDLKQEILLSSTTLSVGNQTLYLPNPGVSSPNSSMVPQRSGNPPVVSGSDPIPNLIRLSRAGLGSTSTLSISGTASAINTGSASFDGRFISPSRWNSHYLIPRATPGQASDPTPVQSFSAPDWVYLTRCGPAVLGNTPYVLGSGTSTINNPIVSNTNFVTGRYAYAVYDEGGLLDINVAGHPSQLSPGQLATKGNAALADLTQLGLQQQDVDKLVGWRNVASSRVAGKFGAYAFDSTAASNWLTSFVFGNTTGYLKTLTVPPYNGLSDQAYVSRQQLIRMFSSLNLNRDPLQYLGTFSREVASPTWSPSTPTGSTVDYAGQKDLPTSANRLIPGVRVGSTFTRLTGEQAIVGEPLIKYRFPLSWLVLLQDSNLSTGSWDLTPEAVALVQAFDAKRQANGGTAIPGANSAEKAAWLVQRAFGLAWNQSEYRWDYTGSPSTASNPTALAGSIALLGTVAGQNREPNFFELLKAGILAGSLGLAMPGSGLTTAAVQNSSDFQVLRIGACAIDQTKTDSYPTRIAMDALGAPWIACGVQRLPYISRWTQVPIRNTAASDPTTLTPLDYQFSIVVVPVLANPFQGPGVTNANNDLLPLPTKRPNVRVTIQGTVVSWDGWNTAVVPQVISPTSLPLSTVGRDAMASFGQDSYITTADAATPPPASGPGPYSGQRWEQFMNNPSWEAGFVQPANPPTYNTGRGQPVGFRLAPRSPASTGTTGGTPQVIVWYGGNSGNTSPFQLSMEFQAPNGQWYPYSLASGVEGDPATWPAGIYSYCADLFGADAAHWEDVPVPQWKNMVPYSFAGTGGVWLNGKQPNYATSEFDFVANFCQVIVKPDPLSIRFNTVGSNNHNLRGLTNGGRLTRSLWNMGSANYRNSVVQYTAVQTPGPRAAAAADGGFALNEQNPVWHSTPPSLRNLPFPPVGSDTTKSFYPSLLCRNTGANETPCGTNGAMRASYTDPDGVQRIADCGLYPDPTWTATVTTSGNPTLPGAPIGNNIDRPLVLNRPFRSVGELGYVFRDQPFKTLSFFTGNSADAGLLDLFCISESPVMRAGVVNLNTRQAPVLQSLIAGAATRQQVTPATASAGAASSLASSLTAYTAANPLANKADLAKFVETNGPVAIGTALGANSNYNKQALESVVRALAESGQTRTWNLLIDVIAQTGRYPSNLANSPGNYGRFLIEGERRYWVHVAIDRFTGEVIDKQLELVTE